MDAMENEIELLKKQITEALKNYALNELHSGFVDNFKEWNSAMKFVNKKIKKLNPNASLYTYNEMCNKILEMAADFYDFTSIKKVFLTKQEYVKLAKSTKNVDEFKDEVHKATEHKFKKNVLGVFEKMLESELINSKIN